MAVAGGRGEIVGPERNLTRRVAAHYDELSGHYVDLWGEHIHHGYYPRGDETRNEATRALIELLLRDIELRPGSAVLDVGCGVGGTSRLLASEHGCRVVGVTLSRVQAHMAADASAGEALATAARTLDPVRCAREARRCAHLRARPRCR